MPSCASRLSIVPVIVSVLASLGGKWFANGRNPGQRSSLPHMGPTRYITEMPSRSASDEAPSQCGYAMPAEWSQHRRTWMCWPCRTEAWGSVAQMQRARAATAEIARAVSRFEPVVMIARPADAQAAEDACGAFGEILGLPIDDSWARDSGPTFVAGTRVA